MNNLLALTINGTPIQAPPGIPTDASKAGSIIGWGITILLIVAVFLAFGFLFWGGFDWMTSQGDKEKLHRARLTIIFSIVGLLICFLAFTITALFSAFFNINLLQLGL